MPRTSLLCILPASWVLACGGPPAAPPPNVLLISLDSTRRDILSCYGHSPPHAPGVPTSPQIDRLAAEGVRFERAYATTSWTLPSHMSLFTGQPELVHGVELDNLELAQGHPTLTESLQRAGLPGAGRPPLTMRLQWQSQPPTRPAPARLT
jgi:hypothetical protein